MRAGRWGLRHVGNGGRPQGKLVRRCGCAVVSAIRFEPHVFPLTNAHGSAPSPASSPAAVPAELQQRGGTRVQCVPLTPGKTIICCLN